MLDAKKITFNSIKLVITEIAYGLILTLISIGKQVLNTIITQYGVTSEIQRLKGETPLAVVEAIKIRAKALENVNLPKVVTSNDLKVLGLDSLIREATEISR